jgi:hypothetical protein
MANSKQIIISNFLYHINSWGGEYSDWIVGITSDVKEDLFIGHNITNETGWIWDECENGSIAYEIKDYFIKLGAISSSDGNDIESNFIYVYKKSANTTELI